MTRAFSICALATTLAVAAPARGDQATDAARVAYDRGASAYDAGDYPRAAVELAKADELAANDVALELAIKAAVKADNPRLAMTLAARGARRSTAGVAAAVELARSKMAGRTGTIIVMCPMRAGCVPVVDGEVAHAGAPHIVLVGDHTVVVEGGGGPRDTLPAKVTADAIVEVRASPPRAQAEPVPVLPAPRAKDEKPSTKQSTPSNGISPAWFWASLGLTAVLGGVTAASAVDTRKKHEDFLASPSESLQNAGLDAQLRTNLLVGATGVAALATVFVGVFFVGWRGDPGPPQQTGSNR